MSCAKSKYRTAADALYQISQLKKRHGAAFVPMKEYHCASCDCWHLTSHLKEEKIPYDKIIKEKDQLIAGLKRINAERNKTIKTLRQTISELMSQIHSK